MGVTLSSEKCMNKVKKAMITKGRERGNKSEEKEKKRREERSDEKEKIGERRGGEDPTLWE